MRKFGHRRGTRRFKPGFSFRFPFGSRTGLTDRRGLRRWR